MKPLSILLALCVVAVAQIVPPKPNYSFGLSKTNIIGFQLVSNSVVHFVLHGEDAGEFFLLLSNRVWQPNFATNTVLKPVPLISLTNLVNALTVSGDICRVKGHSWELGWAGYNGFHRCRMCKETKK